MLFIYRAQIFRDNCNFYGLSIFRDFILLASSGNNMHILMRQKMETRIPLLITLEWSVKVNTLRKPVSQTFWPGLYIRVRECQFT